MNPTAAKRDFLHLQYQFDQLSNAFVLYLYPSFQSLVLQTGPPVRKNSISVLKHICDIYQIRSVYTTKDPMGTGDNSRCCFIPKIPNKGYEAVDLWNKNSASPQHFHKESIHSSRLLRQLVMHNGASADQ